MCAYELNNHSNITIANQISSSLKDASGNIDGLSEQIEMAFVTAADGQDIIKKTIDQINLIKDSTDKTAEVILSLKEKSTEIGEINNIISQIAQQTNLLSLNAAIEAARAGEQGRGFAVVADEIRKLAYKAQMSASNIKKGIDDIQKEIHTANDLIIEEKEKVTKGVEAVKVSEKAFDSISLYINEAAEHILKVVNSFNNSTDLSRALIAALESNVMASEANNNDRTIVE